MPFSAHPISSLRTICTYIVYFLVPLVPLTNTQLNDDTFQLSWNFKDVSNARNCPIYSNVVYVVKQGTSEVQRYTIYPAASTYTLKVVQGSNYDVTVTGECISTTKVYAKEALKLPPLRKSTYSRLLI